MILLNINGDDFPKEHGLYGVRGKTWISVATAIGMRTDSDGTIIVYPGGYGVRVDESPEEIAELSRASR